MNRRTIGAVCGSLLAITLSATTAASDAQTELFAQQPIMVGAHLSPDGTQIVFMSSLQGRYHVVIERFAPTFSRHILYPSEGLEFEWVRWANNERVVLSASYAARRVTTESTETRLLSVNALAQDLRAIIKPARMKVVGTRISKELPPAQIQDNVIDWLDDDPDHILVAIDADMDGATEVRKIDVNNGDYEVVLSGFPGRQSWLTSGSGQVAVGLGYDNDSPVVLIRSPDGEWQNPVSKPWLEEGFLPAAFTGDDNVLLVMGQNEKRLTVVRTVDLTTDQFIETVFEHDHVDADSVIVDGSSGVGVGVSYIEHSPATFYFDNDMHKLKSTIDKALPDTTNRIVSMSNKRRQILILSNSATNPGSYFIWDRDGKSLSLYSDMFENSFDTLLSTVKAVSYEARDGLMIPAYLTLPHGSSGNDLPTIVMPHGGPRGRADKSYYYLSQFLASRGYAVLQPNFRGSSGYGEAFADAGLSEWGGKMQDDVTDGARWLIDQRIADPERLCIVGWSYGGYAAAMGAVKTPDLYQCAASINGVLNLQRQIVDDVHYVGGSEWTKHMGLEGEKSKSVSPYHQVERIVVPILIIQAADDTRVHIEQGRGMAKKLSDLGKKFEYVEIDFGGHSMHNVSGRTTILESLDSFLGKHL